jgi:outer membrane autotransporter protein
VPDRVTSGTVDAFHGAIYGAYRSQGFYGLGILAYDHFNNTESRVANIPGVILPASLFIDGPYVIPGFHETPSGSWNSQSFSSYGEVGYEAKFGSISATPFAGLEFSSLSSSSFTESNQGGPSVIGLSYASTTIDTLPSYLGLQLEGKTNSLGQMGLDVWVRAAWQHEFDLNRSTNSSFISAPGFNFTIQGAEPPADALVTSVGAKLNITKNVAVFGTFEGQFGEGGANSIGGTGGLVFTW